MLWIAISPKHVLQQIGSPKIKEHTATMELAQRRTILLNAFCDDSVRLFYELLFVQSSMRQRFRVLRDAIGVEPAKFFGHPNG